MENFLYGLTWFWEYFRNVVDILVVAAIFYWLYSFMSNTRVVQIAKGLTVIVVLAILAVFLKLDTVVWMIHNFTQYVIIAMIVLFQPELRRLLSKFGKKSWISANVEKEPFQLDELVNSLLAMADEKVGSLIVIERRTNLSGYIESGVVINADISEELIRTIFFLNTQLHDGALIIQNGKIASAACYLPLSDSKQLKKHHGARHRAALGMAEETDALVLVTSEETGDISIMVNGKLMSKIKRTDLKNMILYFMNPKTAYEEKYSIK